MGKPSLIILILVSLLFSQNAWRKSPQNEIGKRIFPAIVYCPDSNRFILSMGVIDDTVSPYAEMMYDPALGKWMNMLPEDSLYGVWADSTGNAYGRGAARYANFNTYYFEFKDIIEAGGHYLRPYLRDASQSRSYYQYAYNGDDKKIYYYMNNFTFTYNTLTRRFDTLSPAVHPAMSEGGDVRLKWGSMCYDPINREILLFGGGGVDMDGGAPGTWVYRPSANTWTRLRPAAEPPSRALAPLVYDAKNQVIVMFGGDHLDVLFSDTWVYQCATREWVKKNPPLSPSPRAGHALLYLPKSQAVVLVGGFVYTSATGYQGTQYRQKMPLEMWRYDAAADEWKVIKTFAAGGATPYLNIATLLNYCMPTTAAADTGDRILAMGNDTLNIYQYRPKTYLLDCDPSATDDAATLSLGVAQGAIGTRTGPFDPAWYDLDVAAADTAAHEALLRALPENQWVKITPPKLPGLTRVWGTTVYDPDRDLFLKWAGGHYGDCGTEVAEYAVSGNRWHIGFRPEWILDFTYFGGCSGLGHYSFSERPFMTGHTYDNYSYDPVIRKMVLVKEKYTYLYDPDNMDWDTARILNHPKLAKAHIHHTTLTGTPHGTFAWALDGATNSAYNFFLLSADSMKWRLLPVLGAAPPKCYTDFWGSAYDAKRDRILLFGNSAYPNLWAYSFADDSLTVVTPAGEVPPAPSNLDTLYMREMVYEPDLDIVFLQCHYAYDCAANRWLKLTIPKGAGVGAVNTYNSGYMYDSKRKLIWDCEIQGETYALKLTSGTLSLGNRTQDATESPLSLSIGPNPFNPTCRISFTLQKKSDFRLEVYDAEGRLVRKLTEGEKGPGRHASAWDAVDSRGRKAGSGIYLFRLSANGDVLFQKGVLCR